MSSLVKIFVGNVPFDCTQKQFEETFVDVPGFVKGDIVTKPRSTVCRGFGFVTIDNKDNSSNSEDLKNREDIFIRKRQLRFTKYNLNDKKYKGVENYKEKYLFVDGLPKDSNREYLKQTFKAYQICKHYVSTDLETGEIKNHGVVEIVDIAQYKKLLEDGCIEDVEGNTLKISRWRFKTYRKRPHVSNYDFSKKVYNTYGNIE